ncbi:hypothetical protein AAFC00_000358 [Neodothiora populina]|uniref:RNA polymerase II holoenzyme cyclin-like subunit n=1 Tax=Neodothiora populina TaxID=2781224 RepID=A0ABR3PD38_9PEZI
MAANYWDSTQARFWTFTKDGLGEIREALSNTNRALVTKHPLPDPRLLSIYFQQQITKLARRMNLRQQPIATAQIYIRRFYTKVEIRRTNPYAIMTTAVYLASKMEESPVHIRFVLGEAARQWPELGFNDISKIGECEFHMISVLSARLIIHHPYRTLSDLSFAFPLTTEESALAHSIINDHYNTDLPLLYPPHIIAVTAIFLSVVLKPAQSGLQAHAAATSSSNLQVALQQGLSAIGGTKSASSKITRLVEWLAESKIDMEAVIVTTQELISLYEIWESYNERLCRDAISAFMKDSMNK